MAADPSMIDGSLLEAQDLPTDTGVKIAHHAQHHQHQHEHDGDGAHSKKKETKLEIGKEVDAKQYAEEKAQTAAKDGAIQMALFSILFIGIKIGLSALLKVFLPEASFVEGALLDQNGAFYQLATAIPAAGMTGALWFGTRTYQSSHKEAKEHNQGLYQRVKKGLGFGRERSQDVDIEGPPTQSVVIMSEPGRLITNEDAAGIADMDAQDRPTYLNNILENGPNHSSRSGYAARVTQEKASAQEQSI